MIWTGSRSCIFGGCWRESIAGAAHPGDLEVQSDKEESLQLYNANFC